MSADIHEELRRCQQAHSDAEQKVEELLAENLRLGMRLAIAESQTRRLVMAIATAIGAKSISAGSQGIVLREALKRVRQLSKDRVASRFVMQRMVAECGLIVFGRDRRIVSRLIGGDS